MNNPEYLSWENFRATVFRHGEQRVHRISQTPRIEIFGDGIRNRIGLLVEVSAAVTLPTELFRLRSISVGEKTVNGRRVIEIASADPGLHREFYHFSYAVADRILIGNCPAVDAIVDECRSFGALLDEKNLLSIERQVGLLGELVFLERIEAQLGSAALDAWIGPLPEPHDFRIGNSEFEVKTTTSPRRVHTINGLSQLIPSSECALYLVSIVLGPAGAGGGFSLAEKVTALGNRFSASQARLDQFMSAVQGCGYRTEDSVHYKRQYVVRRPLAVIRITPDFPAITAPLLQKGLGAASSRIDSVHYDVNAEGLEHEDGADDFVQALSGSNKPAGNKTDGTTP